MNTNTIKKPILLIDGLNVFIRHFAVNESVTAGGDLVGGVLGFTKALGHLIEQFKPEVVYVVWEQGGPSPRRKSIYSEYKANRATNKQLKEMYRQDGKFIAASDTQNKLFQLQLLTKILGELPVCQLFLQDTECDDIIAYLAKRKFQGRTDTTKIVVSSDKDFYQLLEDPTVRIYDPGKKLLVGADDVLERFGVHVRNITLARAVVGDPSDNLDGIPGIGFKTLTSRYPGIRSGETDLDASWLEEASRKAINESGGKKLPKCYSDVLQHLDVVNRNWRLMFLDTSCLAASQIAKIDYKVDNFEPKYNKMNYLKIFSSAGIPVSYDIDNCFNATRLLLR
jgi:DNA polymerase-1